MALTRELIGSLKPGQSLSIFIGPEGGFSDGEVELAMHSGVRAGDTRKADPQDRDGRNVRDGGCRTAAGIMK